MLTKIKALLGITDTSRDDVLNTIIGICQDEFADYCNIQKEDIPESAESVIIELVLIRYHRIHAEGLSSQSFSGVSESFIDGYPDNIRKAMNRYRKVKLV